MEGTSTNEVLADKLMKELRLEFEGYRNEEVRAELIHCLPDILKLDVSLLQNEIKSIGEDIADLEAGREKEVAKSAGTIKRSYELLRELQENDRNIGRVAEPLTLQLRQFCKTIERAKVNQMSSTADLAGELTDVSQDLQELIELPQLVLKAIKAQAFETAIDIIGYFSREMIPKLEKIAFVSSLKEEMVKLTEALKDKIKESINAQVDPASTLKRLEQLKTLSPAADTLQFAEEYLKLRDARFTVAFNKSLFSLVHKLPSDFADFATADQQNIVMAYTESVEDLPEVIAELHGVRREFAKTEQGWRVSLMMEEWAGEHIRKFLTISKIAVELVTDKDRGEVANRVFNIADKFSVQGIEIRPSIRDFCEEFVINKVNAELANKAKDELVREIKKGVKQRTVDTQSIASDVPEEIHINPTYLMFIGHVTNGLTTIKELCTKLRIENLQPVADLYLKIIVEIGALYTEYLSAAENWMAGRDSAREEALLGFKTYCEIVVPFLIEKIAGILKQTIPQEEKGRIRLQCIDWLSLFLEELA